MTPATTETVVNIYFASPTEIQVQKQSLEEHHRDGGTSRENQNSWETPNILYFVKIAFSNIAVH